MQLAATLLQGTPQLGPHRQRTQTQTLAMRQPPACTRRTHAPCHLRTCRRLHRHVPPDTARGRGRIGRRRAARRTGPPWRPWARPPPRAPAGAATASPRRPPPSSSGRPRPWRPLRRRAGGGRGAGPRSRAGSEPPCRWWQQRKTVLAASMQGPRVQAMLRCPRAKIGCRKLRPRQSVGRAVRLLSASDQHPPTHLKRRAFLQTARM